MVVVGMHEAKTQLSKLVQRAEAGEEIVIERRGTPVARLVAIQGERSFAAALDRYVVAPDDRMVEPESIESVEPNGGRIEQPVGLLAAGGAAAWFVLASIMDLNMTLLPGVAVSTVVLALVLTVGFGLIGTWRVLGHKAAPVLRNL